MKHFKVMSKAPARAQSIGIGQILLVISQILSVLGGTLQRQCHFAR